ncbi:PA2778 family cysteine peptidase [Nitrosophilus kaiyonis]|uniref:PA2778 family cysteine peptidase n=1 Tax=Nitrosophilus kaiyonis TaxID=2930200 RepID=UPI0024931C44|nr:PA2778 family cysteine peptidase [Nitrosophilus kaiyonis]
MLKKGWFLILIPILFISCSNKLPNLPKNIENKKILNVPYVSQKEYFCGPASVLMILKYWHKKGDIKDIPKYDEIIKRLYVPSKKGAYQIEIKSAIRDYNLLYFEKKTNIDEILKAVDKNIPVLVLLNLAFENYPMWHYAVVSGYDLRKREIYLHSRKKYEVLSFYNFYNLHKKANFWTLFIVPNDFDLDFISKKDFLRTAVELENAKKYALAIKAYLNFLKKYPNDKDLLFGLANCYFLSKKYKKAKNIYLKIINIENDPLVYNNLALTYLNLRECNNAKEAIFKAMNLDKKNSKIYKSTLEEILKKCR